MVRPSWVVLPSASVIGIMSRCTPISRLEWDKTKESEPRSKSGDDGCFEEGLLPGARDISRPPTSMRLQADKNLCSVALIGYRSESQDVGLPPPAPTSHTEFQITRFGQFEPYAPKQHLCLYASVSFHLYALQSKTQQSWLHLGLSLGYTPSAPLF